MRVVTPQQKTAAHKQNVVNTINFELAKQPHDQVRYYVRVNENLLRQDILDIVKLYKDAGWANVTCSHNAQGAQFTFHRY
jgi:uncharacterized radical SAM superfamily Fe-S cluster-containing enzyme